MNIIAMMRLSRYKSKQTDLALKGFVICIYECSDKLSNDWIWLNVQNNLPSEIGSSVEGDHYVTFFKIYSKFLLIRNQSSVLNFFSQFSSSFLVVKQVQMLSLFITSMTRQGLIVESLWLHSVTSGTFIKCHKYRYLWFSNYLKKE